jgi:hypothetical protein
VERRVLVWLQNAERIGWIKGGEIGVEVKNGTVGWKEGGVRTEERN